ncbi:MAG TPA: GNAT family N-acetyltransferase [Thermoleophilia bacterium]|nr:GNAT family N-acetyltransferase [Acidobacteriota bacterium]HQH22626.1 GNAT family N-acetyltransferase [Thermoleophilia bacterium]
MEVLESPIDDPRWRELADTHPDAGPFHLPAWASLIADCYRFRAFALTVREGDEVLAGLPVVEVGARRARRWVSLPFTDSCAPLIRAGVAADEVFAAIEAHVLAAPVRGLEVRAALPAGAARHPVAAGYIHTLALPEDPSQLRPNKGHRNYRNQAVRKGVRVVRGRSPAELATFYRLHTLTRRRHGVPVQPRRFFDLLQQRLIAPGQGFVATASADGETLAAGVYLVHNRVLVAKYLGSDPSLPDKRAGYLIDWDSMVNGCAEGYHTLDLGRSDPDADGLRLYKSSWGAAEAPLTYTHISRTRPPADRGSGGGGIAAAVIRRAPVWVCRALGELFYRRAA